MSEERYTSLSLTCDLSFQNLTDLPVLIESSQPCSLIRTNTTSPVLPHTCIPPLQGLIYSPVFTESPPESYSWKKKHQQYLLRHIKSPRHSPLRLSFSLPLLCRLLTLPEEPRLQAHSLTEDTWNNYDSKDVSVLRSLYIYFFTSICVLL